MGSDNDLMHPIGERHSQSAAVVASEDDLRKIWSWNQDVPERIDTCVHELIAKTIQTSRETTAPAICAWDGDLTYSELDDYSTRLAGCLAENGVGPEVVVPLCFEKSMWMPVAMLAVMKAGGASLAMDVTQPEERLRSIVGQVHAAFVLCSAGTVELARKLDRKVIVLPSRETFSQKGDTATSESTSSVRPSNTLYVQFTSGSTGKPKGVLVTHSNFSSALHHQSRRLGFGPSSRVLDFASYAFDAAWYNTLHTLYAGGCLCIPSESDRRDDLNGCIARLRPSFANLTPTVAGLLTDQTLQCLDRIELAGEPTSAALSDRIRERTKLRFAYGPAECSVLSTASGDDAVGSNIGFGLGIVPWIVDVEDDSNLVHLGLVGELWIEGPLVGQGYLDEPTKTAAAFVEDPSWLMRGPPSGAGRKGRLYRTGDLVRQQPDGSLLFVGRKDDQRKVRGQRVELGEVEHNITKRLPDGEAVKVVAEVVTLKGGSTASLLAFLSGPESDITPISQIHDTLLNIMPAYMVPSAYIRLADMPMTATGKLDRRWLRDYAAELSIAEVGKLNLARSQWEQPQTVMEKNLRSLWARVLNLQASAIGRNDSFLSIGGDSVAAMRLVAAARDNGLLLTVADIFQHSKLRTMAHVAGPETRMAAAKQHIEPFSLLTSHGSLSLRQDAARLCKVDTSSVADAFPCTPLQKGLLALAAKQRGGCVVERRLSLHATASKSRVVEAWNQVVAKAPILRTRVVEMEHCGLVQVVISEPARWSVVDEPGEVTGMALRAPMGLGTPLARYALLHDQGSGGDVFILRMHHAMCDGWSATLLFDMLEEAYRGTALQCPPQFQRFVEELHRQDAIRAQEFWCKELEGCEAIPFPPLPSANHQPRADAEVEHNIAELRWPKTDITASTILRASWAILAAQYTGSSDVVFGATVSGRQMPLPGIEGMLGPCIATIPVRVLLHRGERIITLLDSIQEDALRCVPFEQAGLQSIQRVSKDAEQAMRFQTLLVIQPPDSTEKPKSGLFIDNNTHSRAEESSNLRSCNPYALLIECRLREDGMQLRFNFDKTVIQEARVERLGHQLEGIVRQLCAPASHEMPLAAVRTISDNDLEAIRKWNAAAPVTADLPIHHAIIRTAQRQPSAPAICAWDGCFTYWELDCLSANLATQLIEHQVHLGPEAIVPLCFEKSKWTAVAMLGVLKAGAAFTMLPPSLPKGRMASMLASLEPRMVVASPKYTELFRNVTVISPESLVQETPISGRRSAEKRDWPSETAAVLWTSGTTGTPKGIVLDHGSISTTAYHLGKTFAASPSTRVFQFAAYSFDVSLHEMFMTLQFGGTLCIPSEQDRENKPAQALTELQANWACLSPSVASAISPEDVRSLETLVFAGETLTEKHIERWQSRKINLFNWYGPAECALSASTPINTDWQSGMIGTGSATRCWIVEKESAEALSPIGAVGELVVEGPCVMQGYLKDAEKTRAALLDTPSWLPSDFRGHYQRLYRTGDLVRYDPATGSILYVGRRDSSQVKLRGQRLELSEVERHVADCLGSSDISSIQVVADIITPKQHTGALLVVFYKAVGHSSAISTEMADLNNRLLDVLPSYMMPTAYVPVERIGLEAVPMTSAGKLDRRRLRALAETQAFEQLCGSSRSGSMKRKRQPNSPVEKMMQKLWASVGCTAADMDAESSFFQLGGDSISAMRLVAAAREAGLSFSVADVFKRPRLSDLASVAVPAASVAHYRMEPFSLMPQPKTNDTSIQDGLARTLGMPADRIEDAYPVTYFQSTCVDMALLHPPQRWNYFVVDLPINSPLDKLVRASVRIWDSVEILRAIFVRFGSDYVQVMLKRLGPPILAYETEGDIQDLTSSIHGDDSRYSGMLGAPFTRFFLLTSAKGARRLMLRLSHAQYDSVTLAHIVECLQCAYAAKPLPKATGFAPYMQHCHVNERECRKYWRALLQGSQLTRLSSRALAADGSAIIARKAARQLQPPRDCTPATAFTAACGYLLSRLVQTSDVTFSRVLAGRAMLPVPLRSTMGPCLNILPVRVSSTGILEYNNILQSVHQQYIDSLSHDTISFPSLRDHCTKWPSDSRQFGCITHYQDLGDAQLDVNGRVQQLHMLAPGSVGLEGDTVMISAKPTGDQLVLEIVASNRFYTEPEVQGWLDRLVTILETTHQAEVHSRDMSWN